ncbi:MAG: para-nitrobenzyl esterase [Paraglaciecola sp.]|jgi:para-nitrobenzyl esterase
MQKIFTTVFLIFFTSFISFAQQHPTCNGERYLNETFDNFTKTSNIKFGENTTIGGNFQELFMDIYEPTGDDAETRPVIVLAHGGSFVAGSRENMDFLCEEFARRGFVTATIDYRLLDAFVFDSLKITEVVIAAMSDMKAAVRFFREDAATDNAYKIDVDLIFAGGISAGGIMASHIGYVDAEDDIQAPILNIINDLGGFPGNSSTNTQYSSAVQGVLNYSGALKEAKWVDDNDPPLFSVHDDNDGVVPYGNGFSSAFPFGNYLEGSATIKNFADAAGLNNELITIENSDGHVSFFGNNAAEYQDQVIQSSSVFLHDIFCDAISNTDDFDANFKLNVFPNPTSAGVTVEIFNLPSAFDLSIVNLNGQMIYQQKNINNAKFSLGEELFEPGIYLVKMEFSEARNTPIWKKLVVQK